LARPAGAVGNSQEAIHGQEPTRNLQPDAFPVHGQGQAGLIHLGNRTICEFAGEKIVGKTDYQLKWTAKADGLRDDDAEVWKIGQPIFAHEYVNQSEEGKATLNVCKFLGELDGEACVMGISFVME
jgi:hypothetical protein